MWSTPARPVKRRLFFSPASAKRARVSAGPVATRAFRASNKHYGRGVSKTGSLYQQVRALQRFVGTLKPEIKFHDSPLAGTNVPSTGAVEHITDIAQGDTVSTRTGNAINVVSITLKGKITTTGNGEYYRIAIVKDNQTISDSQPTASTIFSDVNLSADPVHVLPTIANLSRFTILYMSKLFYGTGISGGDQPAAFEFSKKVNIKTSYNGTASSDQEKNALYCIFLTDSASNTVDFTGVVRIGFTDI